MTADSTGRLESYRFHEGDWDDYDDLVRSFEWEIPETFNIARYVCDRWAGDGRTALIAETADGREEYTFADVRSRADRFANYLAARGIERGDRVGVTGTQRVEVLATHLACWKLGVTSMPLSERFDPEELEYRLADSEAKAVVTTGDGIDAFRAVESELPALETEVVVDLDPRGEEVTFAAAIDGRSADRETVETDPEDPASVVYTSGTTGDPKGVVLPHQHLLGALPAAQCGVFNLEVRDDDVLRVPVEWSWIGSFNAVVLPALYFGIPVVAADTGDFDISEELGLLDRHDVTMVGGPPTVFRYLFMHPAVDTTDLSSLRVLGFGGEVAGKSIVERAREVVPEDAAVHAVYGQAEAPVFISDCEALGVENKPGKMGKAAPGHDVRVVDPDTLEPVETGELGEFVVAYEDDPMCFTEYRGDPEKTAEKVRDGWLLSEDLGTVDEDGYLEFHSRKDDLITSGGRKVAPPDVEDAMEGHEAVVNVGVIGIPEESGDQRLKAFVELNDIYDPTEGVASKLKESVKQTYAYVKIGEEFVGQAELKAQLRQLMTQLKVTSVPWAEYDPQEELAPEIDSYASDRLADHQQPSELEFVSELPTTSTRKIRRRDLREREGVET